MSFDRIAEIASDLEEFVAELREAAQGYEQALARELSLISKINSLTKDRERLEQINSAHFAEIERLMSLVGGELLVEDDKTTRTEAINEVHSLRWKLKTAEEENAKLTQDLADLAGNLSGRIRNLEFVTGITLPAKAAYTPCECCAPPADYDLFHDGVDYLARWEPGSGRDEWVWVADEHAFFDLKNGDQMWVDSMPWDECSQDAENPLEARDRFQH